MKHFTFLKPMLLLCALIIGVGTSWAAEKWIKTAPADLTTGDIVVIVDLTSSTAMSNNNGTSSAPAATTVTLNNNQLSGDIASTIQWEVTVDGDSYQFNVPETENFLYCTSTNNGVRVGSNDNNAFTIFDNEGVDFLVNTATTRYVGVYNSQDWRCYTSINNNIKNNVTAFFKKTVSSKTDVTLSFPEESYDADIANGATSFSAPVLTKSADVTVTYSSSNTDVATVNASTGAVTLVKKGTTIITASFAGDATYESASTSYTLNVDDSNAKGSKANPFTVAEAIDFIEAKEYEDINYYVSGIISTISSSSVNSGTLTYYISDDGSTTNQLQVYKGKNLNNEDFASVGDITVGDVVVVVGPLYYYNNKTPEINTGNYIYSTNHKVLADAELIVENDFEMEVTETKLVEDLYATASDGQVTVTSANEEIVKIEEGVLKAVGKGSTTITVSVAASENYAAASENIKVTVTVKPAVLPEGAVGGGFALVTDASTLAEGDKLILVNADGDYAAGTDADKNNRPGAGVTLEEGIITIDENVQVITLEGEADAWYFNVGEDAYLYASSNSSNQMKTNTKKTAGDNGKAAIEIANDGTATITFQGANSRNTVRFNPNNGSPLFSCYASTATTGTLPKLYRLNAASSFDITMTDAEWRTLVSAADATLPEGLTAYVVTTNDGTTATLTEAAAIKANTPYILKGAAGDYTLTVADGVEAPASNLLQISTESTGNGVYVLAKGTDGVGFYKWDGGSLGAGRVYLPATAGARDFIGFSFGEATGINAVENAKENGAVYNLAGQRVAQPTRGLYIVNGKKFVVK